jgi:hypothetical protein
MTETTIPQSEVRNPQSSETIGQLAGALAAAQNEFGELAKNKENPYYRSRYLDLQALVEATRPVLGKHGLMVLQTSMPTRGDQVHLRTVLYHESGEWMADEICLAPEKTSPQAIGSALTYARRYAWMTITGAVAEDDDDGNAASTPKRRSEKPPPPKTDYSRRNEERGDAPVPDFPGDEPTIDRVAKQLSDELAGVPEHIQPLVSLLAEHTELHEMIPAWMDHFGIEKWEQLTPEQADSLVAGIEQKLGM